MKLNCPRFSLFLFSSIFVFSIIIISFLLYLCVIHHSKHLQLICDLLVSFIPMLVTPSVQQCQQDRLKTKHWIKLVHSALLTEFLSGW